MISLQISFDFFLFFLGIYGIWLNRRHYLFVLVCIEIVLLSLNLNFLLMSLYFDDLTGYFFSLFMLTIAAAESAVGLALIILYYKTHGTILLVHNISLKG